MRIGLVFVIEDAEKEELLESKLSAFRFRTSLFICSPFIALKIAFKILKIAIWDDLSSDFLQENSNE